MPLSMIENLFHTPIFSETHMATCGSLRQTIVRALPVSGKIKRENF